MKKFSNYQYVEGFPMTERDKKEVGSKFWNEGKWENYVKPFIKEDPKDKTLVDIGCNAGIFLREAKDMGFERVIGVEADGGAYRKAIKYRKMILGDYEIYKKRMETCLKWLPMADYTVLANAHYYMLIKWWLDYLDKLRYKTRYAIIVSAKKGERRSKASADPEHIKEYFKDWEFVGEIPEIPLKDDPFPRRLYGLCFKSKDLHREILEDLDNGNHQQDDFYKELDEGKKYNKTNYYKRMKSYRKNQWSAHKLDTYMKGKAKLYKDIKKNGIREPIILLPNKRIVDGNHRSRMLKNLGYKTVITRHAP